MFKYNFLCSRGMAAVPGAAEVAPGVEGWTVAATQALSEAAPDLCDGGAFSVLSSSLILSLCVNACDFPVSCATLDDEFKLLHNSRALVRALRATLVDILERTAVLHGVVAAAVPGVPTQARTYSMHLAQHSPQRHDRPVLLSLQGGHMRWQR